MLESLRRCPTCGGDGSTLTPFNGLCPAAWAHDRLSPPSGAQAPELPVDAIKDAISKVMHNHNPFESHRVCARCEAESQLTALLAAAKEGRKDTERLDWIAARSVVGGTEDGERVGLWITDSDNEMIPALAVIADVTGEDGELLSEDAPFLCEAQITEFNEKGVLSGPDILRKAPDAARTPDPAREEDDHGVR